MAENFKGPKAKAPVKKKAPAKKSAATSKADGLRQMREKAAETGANSLVISATGEVITANLKTVEDFVQAGSIVWRKTLDSILTMSKIVDLAHDRLSRDGYQEFIKQLHMSDSSANQLRKITATPRIERLIDQGKALPASTHTLYLMSSMSDDEFKDFEKQHDVDADVRVEDVRSFLKDRASNKPPKERKPPQTTGEAMQQAQTELANQMTAPVPSGPVDREGAEDVVDLNAQGADDLGSGQDDTLTSADSEAATESLSTVGIADLVEGCAATISGLKPEDLASLDIEVCSRILAAIDTIARHIADIRDDIETDVFNRS